LLAREAPRTWIRLQADVGVDWPLWRPGAGVLPRSELPCSDALVTQLLEWQRTYAQRALPPVSRGVSIFKSHDEAVVFVPTGTNLADALQDELGERWHVEYSPPPTNPPGGFRTSR